MVVNDDNGVLNSADAIVALGIGTAPLHASDFVLL
jgi:hypothetical protein